MNTGLPLSDQPRPIALNRTVEPQDEMRLSRQAQEILELFQRARQANGYVTTGDLMRIAGQYNGRLYEVRRHLISRG